MDGDLGSDPARLRIGDTDRRRAADFLRGSAGQGRLDADELDERLEQVRTAKTYADLVPIVIDLPSNDAVIDVAAPGPPAELATTELYETYVPDGEPSPEPRPGRPGEVPTDAVTSSLGVLGGQERKGAWRIAPTHSVFVLMGGVELDLREVTFSAPETVISANVLMGGLDITVNAYTRVILEGTGIMGGFGESKAKVGADWDEDSPVVRIKGVAVMGGVGVTRKPMPGEKKPKRLP